MAFGTAFYAISCYNNLIMLIEQDFMLSERHSKLFGRDIKML